MNPQTRKAFSQMNWPEDMTPALFMAQYWQKKPLLLRGAFAGFENPLSPDELGGLALDEEINSRLILRESDEVWHMRSGPFTEEELTSLPARDWSLLVSDVEKHLDDFHQYLQPFRFVPDWQIDDLMISYAPTGASVGAHIDEYDVFLLQAAGARQWSIDSRDTVDSTYLPDLDIRVLKNFNANEQWTLRAGDMLYLPPGVPHHGISLDDECMTWSIGFRAVAHAELLTEIAQQLAIAIPDTARYRDRAGALQTHPAEISEATMHALHGVWKKLTTLDGVKFRQLVGNVLTQRNTDFIAVDTQQQASIDHLLQHGDFARDSASRMAFVVTTGGVILHVDGHAYPVTESIAKVLCDSYRYSYEELAPMLKDAQNQDCILKLWQRGILLPGS